MYQSKILDIKINQDHLNGMAQFKIVNANNIKQQASPKKSIADKTPNTSAW